MKPVLIGAAVGAIVYCLLALLRIWAYRNGRIAKGVHYDD